MPVITEVRFAHETGALAETLAALPDLDVRVIREAGTGPQRKRYFLRFDHPDRSEVAAALDADSTVSDVRPMPEFEQQNLWGVQFSEDVTLLAPKVTSKGGFVVDARSSNVENLCGWHERWLLPDREAIHDIWQYAREEGFQFEILDLRQGGNVDSTYPGSQTLTEEQHQALKTAYEQGYFTEPREASLEDLAELLDRSPSAVGGRLKRGMKSLIEGTLVVDRPETDSR